MNRRPILIALAVLLLVAIFATAKSVARWRPSVVGPLNPHIPFNMAVDVSTSERYVVAGAGSSYTRFDLETGTQTPSGNAGLTSNGAWTWEIKLTDEVEFRLHRADGPTTIYRAPLSSRVSKNYSITPDYVRVMPQANRVDLRHGGIYYRWNLASRRLERHAGTGWWEDAVALSRDGETEISANRTEVTFTLARTGRVTHRVALPEFEPHQKFVISSFGAYAVYDVPGAKGPDINWRIVNTKIGRVAWQFKGAPVSIAPIFSPDETQVAFAAPDRHHWEIRDLATGALVRTLPLVPKTKTGAFSPDGATLYSVALGSRYSVAESVLYRQRAR